MTVTRNDVISAYELLLGRPPESEVVIAAQVAGSIDRHALTQNIINSSEARERFGLSNAPHEHHIYRGYAESDTSVLYKFRQTSVSGSSGFITNFLGCRYRVAFSGPLIHYDGAVEGYPLPAGGFQGETAEFIGALRSVLDAQNDRYRMLECGAGYGTWMAITFAAAQQKKIANVHVYGIEGDAGHFAFLLQHMADNAIPGELYTALNGAVGSAAGVTEWPIADDPADVYGGRPLENGGIDYHGLKPKRTVAVEVFALPEILAREQEWDLVHMDIQGGEGALCRNCIEVMSQRVRRVIVGTHSRALDGEVMATFHKAGWSLENEKPTISHWRDRAATLESLAVVDGVQVWKNPRI